MVLYLGYLQILIVYLKLNRAKLTHEILEFLVLLEDNEEYEMLITHIPLIQLVSDSLNKTKGITELIFELIFRLITYVQNSTSGTSL